MPIEHVETLIVGGGQAGLVMSHMLSQRDCPHLVLERHRIAERWRSERWAGLRFQFPNGSVRLPGFPFAHADPNGFATGPEIVEFLDAYAAFIAAPVRCGVEVMQLRASKVGPGFTAETSNGRIEAGRVVIATGPYQQPVVPKLLPEDSGLCQVHASQYREPGQLPAGAVLIVGSGASGTQIAEELLRSGRRVYLSVGHHRRMPRRYRGRDLIDWLSLMGLDQTPVERRGPDRSLPLITGAYGGHTLDFRELAAQGITLLGRVESVRAGVLNIGADLGDNIASGDAAYLAFLDTVDAYLTRQGLTVTDDPDARVKHPDPTSLLEPLRTLDLRANGITSVVWATGYRCDFDWIELPLLDDCGEPLHEKGITEIPGLYFLGLPWLSKMNSSFMSGVGDDAARLADHIAARSSEPVRRNLRTSQTSPRSKSST